MEKTVLQNIIIGITELILFILYSIHSYNGNTSTLEDNGAFTSYQWLCGMFRPISVII